MPVIPEKEALIVFMRYPEEGKVKSRLAASIGFPAAARIYEKLVRRTLGITADFLEDRPGVQAYLFYTPAEKRKEMEARFPGPWRFQPQEGSHLGDRMGWADQWVRDQGYSPVVLIGTDIPGLEAADLEGAFTALRHGDAVFGPASDGGFYLVGLRGPFPPVFEPARWGVDGVMERSEGLLRRAGWRVHHLRPMADLDRAEDLPLLETQRIFKDRLSVIIPTIAPLHTVQDIVTRIQKEIWPGDEIVVAWTEDGGGGTEPAADRRCGNLSSQRKEEEKPRHGGDCETIFSMAGDSRGDFHTLRWVRAPRGRGLQMNAGAAAARGNLLLFLHDDSLPPPGFAYSIRKICADPQVSVGCFRLAFSPHNRALRCIAAWANFRSRFLRMPYGDQGLFCSKEVFDKLGGYRLPFLMEDADFVRRAGRLGKVAVLPQELTTSSRRYLDKGVLRASLQNHALMCMHWLGVDNIRLYSIYYGRGSPRGPDRLP